MSLINRLPCGPLDIVGDVHGELSALENLLRNLGYDSNGKHAENRTLVFVGDLCDRGPDSPGVLSLVENLFNKGKALVVLGNHEINLIAGDAKEGSGWFFDEFAERDQSKYSPFKFADKNDQKKIVRFLSGLPLALERDDLRIIHAAWIPSAIDIVRSIKKNSFPQCYFEKELETKELSKTLARLADVEIKAQNISLGDFSVEPPFIDIVAKHEVFRSGNNPIKKLLCGVERIGGTPFFSNGKWRFVERVKWWEDYSEDIPVVVGHYWRKFGIDEKVKSKRDPNLFEDIDPLAWHGYKNNIFCVDYSVGGRWAERKNRLKLNCQLAALRWPERTLCLEDGSILDTIAFKDN